MGPTNSLANMAIKRATRIDQLKYKDFGPSLQSKRRKKPRFKKNQVAFKCNKLLNKPAEQAAGEDPSQCNSTPSVKWLKLLNH